VLLGLAFGMALVAGLLEVQRLSAPDDLAAMTGLYYSLAYLGFCLPAALAFGGRWFSTDAELGFVAVVALVCTAAMATWPRSVDAQATVANISTLGPAEADIH
jgi:drug/metabolite transporter (DMT)-like permease